MSYKTLIALNIMITVGFVGVIGAFAQTADTTAPVISGVGSSAITQTSAAINWTTDEPADGQMEYGTSTAYNTSSTLAPATTTAHSISLTGLTASTTYHYFVKSKDVAGNLATSSDYTFTTLVQPTATTTPPTATSTVAVKIKAEPKTLNSRSVGKWIEAEVKFPRGTDIRTLDLASIKLNNALAPAKVKISKAKWYETAAFAKKEPKVKMKFARKDLINLLLADTATSTTATATSTTPVEKSITQTKDITISGMIGDATFSGTVKIKFTTPFTILPSVKKMEKNEKKERHDEKSEREEKEHRVATSTSAVSPAATTTVQGVVVAPGIIKKEEKKHKEEKREERKEDNKGKKENKGH